MYFEKDNCFVKRLANGKLPRLPFSTLKNAILGQTYQLSIIFVDTKTAIALHKKYKKKNDPANILSFPLDTKSGEISIHLGTVRREARTHQKTNVQYLGFLLVHGMLHLKGFSHGKAMEKEEEKFCKKFGF